MLDQKLQQKQQQKLSPQQIQVIKLLEIPTMELETRIKEEIEVNPALEVDGDGDHEEAEEKNESNDDSTEFNNDDDDHWYDDDDVDYDDYNEFYDD